MVILTLYYYVVFRVFRDRNNSHYNLPPEWKTTSLENQKKKKVIVIIDKQYLSDPTGGRGRGVLTRIRWAYTSKTAGNVLLLLAHRVFSFSSFSLYNTILRYTPHRRRGPMAV